MVDVVMQRVLMGIVQRGHERGEPLPTVGGSPPVRKYPSTTSLPVRRYPSTTTSSPQERQYMYASTPSLTMAPPGTPTTIGMQAMQTIQPQFNGLPLLASPPMRMSPGTSPDTSPPLRQMLPVTTPIFDPAHEPSDAGALESPSEAQRKSDHLPLVSQPSPLAAPASTPSPARNRSPSIGAAGKLPLPPLAESARVDCRSRGISVRTASLAGLAGGLVAASAAAAAAAAGGHSNDADSNRIKGPSRDLMASSDVTANAEGTERSTFMGANIDKSVEMPASPRGKQLELYGTAIEEVIQQVSMLGIERGKILACLWKRLKSAMALYSTREQAWTLVLCSMHEELEQHKRITFTGGGPASSVPLIASMGAPTRVGVLEPQSRLTNASISVRRHHDTVRWRSALQLAHREKIELTHTLEKLCSAILGDTLAGAVPVARAVRRRNLSDAALLNSVMADIADYMHDSHAELENAARHSQEVADLARELKLDELQRLLAQQARDLYEAAEREAALRTQLTEARFPRSDTNVPRPSLMLSSAAEANPAGFPAAEQRHHSAPGEDDAPLPYFVKIGTSVTIESFESTL
jgi:hypothetical protein